MAGELEGGLNGAGEEELGVEALDEEGVVEGTDADDVSAGDVEDFGRDFSVELLPVFGEISEVDLHAGNCRLNCELCIVKIPGWRKFRRKFYWEPI